MHGAWGLSSFHELDLDFWHDPRAKARGSRPAVHWDRDKKGMI